GGHAAVRSRAFVTSVIAVCAVVATAALVLGMLAGDTWVLLGDIVNWVQGRTGPAYTFVLDARWPRVAAALLAGAALALAGTTVQAVCRNPLAEPGILGITGGAGIGAVSLLTFAPMAGVLALSGAAGLGAVAAFALVYGLARRHGLNSDRLVLIGFAVWQGGTAIITFIVVSSDPWNTGKALTWLSGSTYGRTAPQVLPVVIALLIALPVVVAVRRELDLLALDDDTPRVLGVRLERARLVALGLAALLTATAVSAVGVIGFVGLVAPHAARALVGGRHTRVLPVAVLLGATLVSLADTLGRSVIAPAQVPAGLVTAMIGTPYFVWLLWRSRAAAAAR
ncbi:iron chelate uptake ABC transporter family permease subunit, partial [Micromonospora sp. NPDC005313]